MRKGYPNLAIAYTRMSEAHPQDRAEYDKKAVHAFELALAQDTESDNASLHTNYGILLAQVCTRTTVPPLRARLLWLAGSSYARGAWWSNDWRGGRAAFARFRSSLAQLEKPCSSQSRRQVPTLVCAHCCRRVGRSPHRGPSSSQTDGEQQVLSFHRTTSFRHSSGYRYNALTGSIRHRTGAGVPSAT